MKELILSRPPTKEYRTGYDGIKWGSKKLTHTDWIKFTNKDIKRATKSAITRTEKIRDSFE